MGQSNDVTDVILPHRLLQGQAAARSPSFRRGMAGASVQLATIALAGVRFFDAFEALVRHGGCT